MIIEAIRELGVKEFVCDSSPDTEETFNRSYKSLSEDNPKITWEEVSPMIKNLQASHDTQAYSRKREAEYPTIQECVHAILDDDLDALQAKRADIKTKYPKG